MKKTSLDKIVLRFGLANHNYQLFRVALSLCVVSYDVLMNELIRFPGGTRKGDNISRSRITMPDSIVK